MKTETLQVPDASLYYEVRGSGPVLLMIPGGPMDADGFKGIADRLADTYTVVTYDCRGTAALTATRTGSPPGSARYWRRAAASPQPGLTQLIE